MLNKHKQANVVRRTEGAWISSLPPTSLICISYQPLKSMARQLRCISQAGEGGKAHFCGDLQCKLMRRYRSLLPLLHKTQVSLCISALFCQQSNIRINQNLLPLIHDVLASKDDNRQHSVSVTVTTMYMLILNSVHSRNSHSDLDFSITAYTTAWRGFQSSSALDMLREKRLRHFLICTHAHSTSSAKKICQQSGQGQCTFCQRKRRLGKRSHPLLDEDVQQERYLQVPLASTQVFHLAAINCSAEVLVHDETVYYIVKDTAWVLHNKSCYDNMEHESHHVDQLIICW